MSAKIMDTCKVCNFCYVAKGLCFNHNITDIVLFSLQWYIQATCAIQGHGLYEGLDWLSNELAKK